MFYTKLYTMNTDTQRIMQSLSTDILERKQKEKVKEMIDNKIKEYDSIDALNEFEQGYYKALQDVRKMFNY